MTEHTYENCHNLTCRRKEREYGYQQGRADKEKQIEEMLENLPTMNGYIDSAYLWLKWEQIKEQTN